MRDLKLKNRELEERLAALGDDHLTKTRKEIIENITSLLVDFQQLARGTDIVHAAMSAAGGLLVETQGQSHTNPHLLWLEQMTYGPYPAIPKTTPDTPIQGPKDVRLTMFGGLQKTVHIFSLRYNGQHPNSKPHAVSS
jgi:hypothetical protein